MLNFPIGSLLSKHDGATINFTVDEEVDFGGESDLKLKGNLVFDVQFLKLPHEISVQISNLSAESSSVCSRCLKEIPCKILVPCVEREFIIDLPVRDLQEGEDAFSVNKDKNEIDLTDMVHEELLLHFPAIPLCSESCKGLCDKCGVDLNEESCLCKHDDKKIISPFKFLTR
ncbi:MAG: DUF177 domain-containing protein [Patescibacteria group bacterium]